ncbi:MAG: hypothetical protein M1829_001122 [Trizodia sp. TS-e1964]|nr:MAG: hypothetical protein M1829_001122 [Trizodia sp. TS-e1964]
MTDRNVTDLSYGHFGDASYDTKAKAWHFSRHVGRRFELQPLTSLYCIPGSVDQEIGDFKDQLSDIHKSTSHLALRYPDVAPSIPILPAMARTSFLAEKLASRIDPLVTSRLATGKASVTDGKRITIRTVDILAVVGGNLGHSMKLIRLIPERKGWDEHKGIRLEIPKICLKDQVCWQSTAGSIRQLCFSENQSSSFSYLAARLADSTIIFRPYYHDIPTRSSQNLHTEKLSRLDPNIIATISLESTGGDPHTHLSFNPWNSRMLAILDQSGSWSIWELLGRKVKGQHVLLKNIGHMLAGSQKNTDLPLSKSDGWGRILWVADSDTITLFNRREMLILDLATGTPAKLKAPDLGLARTSRWILDAVRSPSNQGHIFVVTSSQLFWIEIICRKELPTLGGVILMSWSHYRSGEDISLCLEVCESKEDLILLLYSQIVNLVTVFQCLQNSDQLPESISDPYTFENLLGAAKAGTVDWQSHHKTVSTLIFQPLQYVGSASRPASGPGLLFQDQGIQFFQIFTLYNDLGVQHSLYSRRGSEVSTTQQENLKILPPNQTLNVVKSGILGSGYAEDGFVISDLENDSDVMHQLLDSKPSGQDPPDPWTTIDLGWVYDAIFRPDATRPRDIGPEGNEGECKENQENFEESLDEFKEVVIKDFVRRPGVEVSRTLAEIYTGTCFSREIADASDKLLGLIEYLKKSNEPQIEVTKLICPKMGIFSREIETSENYVSFAMVYEYLMRLYVAPLPHNTPANVRMSQERIIRTVAAQLALASIGVTSPGILKSSGGGRPILLPSRAKKDQSPEHIIDSISDTPSKYESPAPSLAPSISTKADEEDDPVIGRLQVYAEVSARIPSNATVDRILSQWEVGEDPDSFEWGAEVDSSEEPSSDEEPITRPRSRKKEVSKEKDSREDSQKKIQSENVFPSSQMSQSSKKRRPAGF